MLPHFAAAMTTSTLEAIAGRVETVGPGRAASAPAPGWGAPVARGRDRVAGSRRWPDGGAASSTVLLSSFHSAKVPRDRIPGWPVEWASWGAAEHQGMGEPRADDVRWEGNMLSFHVGADRRIRRNLLVGVAGSRSVGAYDFGDVTGAREVEGIYEARMTQRESHTRRG